MVSFNRVGIKRKVEQRDKNLKDLCRDRTGDRLSHAFPPSYPSNKCAVQFDISLCAEGRKMCHTMSSCESLFCSRGDITKDIPLYIIRAYLNYRHSCSVLRVHRDIASYCLTSPSSACYKCLLDASWTQVQQHMPTPLSATLLLVVSILCMQPFVVFLLLC